MSPLFAPELIACIKEGRPPAPNEVEMLGTRIWQDMAGSSAREECLPCRSAANAIVVAQAALTGNLRAPSGFVPRSRRGLAVTA